MVWLHHKVNVNIFRLCDTKKVEGSLLYLMGPSADLNSRVASDDIFFTVITPVVCHGLEISTHHGKLETNAIFGRWEWLLQGFLSHAQWSKKIMRILFDLIEQSQSCILRNCPILLNLCRTSLLSVMECRKIRGLRSREEERSGLVKVLFEDVIRIMLNCFSIASRIVVLYYMRKCVLKRELLDECAY